MEDFSTADETQNEALQFIEQFLADEEGFQSLEAERKADVSEKQIGPRRVELLVQERNPSRLPATQKRLVVTSLIEPSGNFRSYLLTGREWRSMEKRDLSKITSTMNSDAVDVLEVFIYDAGSIYTEEREPFSTEVAKQQTAWKRALREFGRLDEPEKVQLRYWDGMAGMSPAVFKPTTTHYPEVDPDFDEYAYTGGWMGRTPSTYKPHPPHKAYFRVAGDSVGTELLRKQQEKLLADKLEIVVVPDLVLREPETKVSEVKPVATIPKTGLPIIFKPADGFAECYCGLPGCDNCHLTAISASTGGRGHRHHDIH